MAGGMRAAARVLRRQRRAMRVTWIDHETLRVGDTRFRVRYELEDLHAGTSSPDDFLLAKDRSLISTILETAPVPVRNMVELGIFKGGSVAFYSLVFSPQRLVAIDLSDQAPALGAFIDRHGLSETGRLCFGVDQGDPVALRDILEANFEPGSLDLVIDDCSHLYGPTKASLNVLLGWLRPGGVYIIEDWGWAHWPGDDWQGPEPAFRREEVALSNLLYEIEMLCASRSDLISEIRVDSVSIVMVRGAGAIGEDFDISETYLTRGRGFEPLM